MPHFFSVFFTCLNHKYFSLNIEQLFEVFEGIEEQARLKEKLYEQLDEMKMSAILEATAQDAENVNIALSYSPGGIYIG